MGIIIIINNILYRQVDLNLDEKDYQFLEHLKNTYQDKAVAVQGRNPNGTLRSVFNQYKNFYLKNSNVDYSTHNLFKKIAKYCVRLPLHSDLMYLYSRAHIAVVTGKLPYHIDARDCVLTIPIGETVNPITWVDNDNNFIDCYHYSGPVLINTKVKHGCLENAQSRILFQIGFNDPLSEIIKLIKLV